MSAEHTLLGMGDMGRAWFRATPCLTTGWT